MKSIERSKSYQSRVHSKVIDDLKERATLSFAFTVILLLYVVMALAVYHWGHTAPIFAPHGITQSAIQGWMGWN